MLGGDFSSSLMGGCRSGCGDECCGLLLPIMMDVPRPGGPGRQQVAGSGTASHSSHLARHTLARHDSGHSPLYGFMSSSYRYGSGFEELHVSVSH